MSVVVVIVIVFVAVFSFMTMHGVQKIYIVPASI